MTASPIAIAHPDLERERLSRRFLRGRDLYWRSSHPGHVMSTNDVETCQLGSFRYPDEVTVGSFCHTYLCSTAELWVTILTQSSQLLCKRDICSSRISP
jgi:hypothetical protein